MDVSQPFIWIREAPSCSNVRNVPLKPVVRRLTEQSLNIKGLYVMGVRYKGELLYLPRCPSPPAADHTRLKLGNLFKSINKSSRRLLQSFGLHTHSALFKETAGRGPCSPFELKKYCNPRYFRTRQVLYARAHKAEEEIGRLLKHGIIENVH